ncbi:MAG TPA: NAD(P)-dependent oxidoreductase [Acidimicrobiales bacterium]|nr:NAD(P)-dependent oxidoreductase [Acidimicrobiales bacterium]
MTDRATVLGTGIMGAGMARSLLAAGFTVTVWNRSLDKAEGLAGAGAVVADDPASAVAGADVIVTMLFDGEATAEVMARALPAAPTTAVWVQCATVGLESTVGLAALAERHGIGFVDAPVLGTRKPAEMGLLIVLGGAPESRRAAVTPVLDAIGSRTVWVGERPGDGQRLKLVLNSWLLSLVGGLAQAIALTGGLGLDPQLFLDTISGGALDCVYAQFKGKKMIAEDFSPDFTLAGATKDSSLIADALRSLRIDDQLMEALHREFRAAADAGYAEEDMAVVVRAFLP